jgi:hypothetical protein
MKYNGWLLVVFTGLFAASACFGQTPPPNDNFSNRIVLTGTDVTFTGTLAGATLEDSQEAVAYDNVLNTPATQSVWWSWTAPVSTVLTLQILSSSLDSTPAPIAAAFVIYDATDAVSSPADLAQPPLDLKLINARLAPQTFSIPVTAGTNYTIQLIGGSSASYTARLIATNTPVIIQQPRSRTVYSNASALFYVVAAGTNQSALAFQWYFNGTNLLAAETAPMLAISNIDSTVAGAYSVAVSNSAGFTMSQPAMLNVSQSNVPISLAVTGPFSNPVVQSNYVGLTLTGENGRSYRLESSTDLTNWALDSEFEREPLSQYYTSVFFDINSPQGLAVLNNTTRKFFRATPYAPYPATTDLCANHLEQIRIAKLLWQRDYAVPGVATPFISDLLPYLPRQLAPFCPLDNMQSFNTSYVLYDLQTEPVCVITSSAHVLEEPR